MEPWQKARDARPVVGAGPGSGRDRPQPGDERRAGIGSQGRAPRRDVRHRQTGEGRGRRARPRGTRVRGGGAWTGRTWPASPACAWPTARSAARRSPPTCSPAGSPAGRAPPPWTPGAGAAGAGTGDIMGRLAWRHGRSRAPFRPWRAAHRPRVRHRGRGMRHASPGRHGRRPVRQRAMAEGADGAYRTGLVRRRKPFRDPRDPESATFGGSRGGDSKRPHRPSGHRTPERTEPSIM